MGDKADINEVHNLKCVKRMLDVMQLLNEDCQHPNIAHLKKVLHSSTHIIIFMQFGGDENLFRRLLHRQAQNKCRPLPLHKLRMIIMQILTVVKYLHEKRICHRDLKPENIIILEEEDNLQCKLADFDLAVVQEDRGLCRSSCGTVPFTAPETLHGRHYNGLTADSWSMGIVLLEACCGVHFVERAIGLAKAKDKGGRPDNTVRAKIITAFGSADAAGAMLKKNHVEEVATYVPVMRCLLNGLLCVEPRDRWTSAKAEEAAQGLPDSRSSEHEMVHKPSFTLPHAVESAFS